MCIKLSSLTASLFLFFLLLANSSFAQSINIRRLGGTLVVAVPVQDGLVACSDKRLFNEAAKTFRDDFVKINKVDNNALFVATHTVGFLDKATGKMEFNVFDITARYVSQHSFTTGRPFWDGLKKEIRDQLLQYLSKRKYQDWPATDIANNKLLFNLVFYAVAARSIRSYSISVFYEKAPTPVVYVQDPVSQIVRTPQLTGKGKAVMNYLARNPQLSSDPSILRFDQTYFNAGKTTTADAVNFAKKLFFLANTALPQAEVSATFDCALLSYQNGFQWLD